jgi:hypothetical protein
MTNTDRRQQPYSDDLWMGWLTDALCAEGATPAAAECYATALLPLIRSAWAEQQAGHEWQCPSCGATTRARMSDQG